MAVANQKGGVAKTTTVQNIAASLTHKGYKTLVIDLDPQGNLSFLMGADNVNKPTMYDVFNGKAKIMDAVQRTKSGAIIPANILLSGADLEFTQPGKDKLLLNEMDVFKSAGYGFILIDTPPSLGVLTINALTAAGSVLIPMGADVLSLQGMSQLYDTIEAVRKRNNPDLIIEGIIFTQYAGRTLLSKEFTKAIKGVAKRLHTKVFDTAIRSSVAAREAQANQVDVITYAPRSSTADDYNSLTIEIIKGGAKRG